MADPQGVVPGVMVSAARWFLAVSVLGAASPGPAAFGQPSPPAKLVDKYARFFGADAARRYLDDLPFEIGGSDEEAITVRSRGQTYRVEIVAIDEADDCETCSGQLDALVYSGQTPVLVESGLLEGGSHGHVYRGDKTTVVPLTRDTDGLLITGEMWAPRGCRLFTAHLFAIDAGAKTMKKLFDEVEESCEDGPTTVQSFTFESRGLDAQGRGLFACSLVKKERRGSVKDAKALRFDAAQWALVKP